MPPVIQSAGAILIDAESGQVLYEKNADAPRPMASTTKIMTALLFCENVADDATVTASPNACKTRESSLHLKPGEKLTAHDLLRAMLLRSANDACVVAAEQVAGTEAAFADRMNARAAQLGATHTHFVNSHGLHDPNHFTSARDLALIARAAMQEPRIAETVGTAHCRITRSIDHNDVTLRNHSHFLGKFPGADGIKTGWTRPAGHCYVGSATYGGWRLISVVLKSPDYVAETRALMKYGFDNFQRSTIARPGDVLTVCHVQNGTPEQVQAVAKRPIQMITRKGETPQVETRPEIPPLNAPIIAGSEIGTLAVFSQGQRVSTSPLVAQSSVLPVPPSLIGSVNRARWEKFGLGAVIFFLGLVSYRYGNRKRNRTAAFTKSPRRRRRRFPQGL